MCMTGFRICYKDIEVDHGVMKTKQKRPCHHDVTEHSNDTDVLIPFILKHGSSNIFELIEMSRAISVAALNNREKHIFFG
jgi:hypothetical protein